MPKMPEKSPDLWAAFLAWVAMHQPQLIAFGTALATAFVRVVYGGGTQRQMLLEGVLCGLIGMSLVPVLQYLNMPASLATFGGCMVGFIGTEKLRDIATRYGEKRAGL